MPLASPMLGHAPILRRAPTRAVGGANPTYTGSVYLASRRDDTRRRLRRQVTERGMVPEMELLDQLEGGEHPYLMMECHVFAGDLRSIEKMRQDGLIRLAIGGREVEGWRLSAWRRSP